VYSHKTKLKKCIRYKIETPAYAGVSIIINQKTNSHENCKFEQDTNLS
jgi:hypothetical protein